MFFFFIPRFNSQEEGTLVRALAMQIDVNVILQDTCPHLEEQRAYSIQRVGVEISNNQMYTERIFWQFLPHLVW